MKIDPNELIEACKNSNSMAEAASKFKINFQTFRRYAKQLNVWKPNQSGRGSLKTKREGFDKYPLEDILNGLYPQYSSHKLRIRLVQERIKENKCECCGIIDWNNAPISFHLDHIDGNHYNHALNNLRILCPNCHSQTLTFGSKKLRMPE